MIRTSHAALSLLLVSAACQGPSADTAGGSDDNQDTALKKAVPGVVGRIDHTRQFKDGTKTFACVTYVRIGADDLRGLIDNGEDDCANAKAFAKKKGQAVIIEDRTVGGAVDDQLLAEILSRDEETEAGADYALIDGPLVGGVVGKIEDVTTDDLGDGDDDDLADLCALQISGGQGIVERKKTDDNGVTRCEYLNLMSEVGKREVFISLNHRKVVADDVAARLNEVVFPNDDWHELLPGGMVVALDGLSGRVIGAGAVEGVVEEDDHEFSACVSYIRSDASGAIVGIVEDADDCSIMTELENSPGRIVYAANTDIAKATASDEKDLLAVARKDDAVLKKLKVKVEPIYLKLEDPSALVSALF